MVKSNFHFVMSMKANFRINSKGGVGNKLITEKKG